MVFHFGQQCFHAGCCLHRVAAGELVDRHDRARFPVQPSDHAVVLRAQLGARDVLHADDAAIRHFPQHDVAELFGRGEPALRAHRIGVLLPLRNGCAADSTGGIHGILRLDRREDFRHCDAELCKLVGLHPQAHCILARAENLHVADSRDAGELIIQIDVGVVGEELRVVGAVRRIQTDNHERCGD